VNEQQLLTGRGRASKWIVATGGGSRYIDAEELEEEEAKAYVGWLVRVQVFKRLIMALLGWDMI
jgi:hypothetical protein